MTGQQAELLVDYDPAQTTGLEAPRTPLRRRRREGVGEGEDERSREGRGKREKGTAPATVSTQMKLFQELKIKNKPVEMFYSIFYIIFY